jgi:hypothetical protein
MAANKLVPLKPIADRQPDENLQKLRSKLSKNSRYLPITLSTTIVYNLKQFAEPFISLIQKPELTEEEVLKCQQTIYNIIALEGRHEPLTLPNMGHRMKANKKEEQYRLLWSELEAVVVASNGKSLGHKTVMQCLRDCRSSSTPGGDRSDKLELDQALRELDSLTDPVTGLRASVIRATTDSPMSPPAVMPGTSSMKSRSKKLQSGSNNK